jgi:hypothetical protein
VHFAGENAGAGICLPCSDDGSGRTKVLVW